MKRALWQAVLATGLALSAHWHPAEPSKGPEPMKAGFAKVSITPPLGTRMMGFGGRDEAHGCTSIHDDVFVRALYVQHAGEEALIMGFDLCFLGRADSDRLKRALRRELRLKPAQILLNASHNHVGPAVGTWYQAPPDHAYLRQLERATVKAASEAKQRAQEVTLWAGATRSKLPVNRRRHEEGGVINAPNFEGTICDNLPIALFKNRAGKPLGLLFSLSCHASMIGGFEISAEYPGAAMKRLDEYLGAEASLFLQGAGGDAKPIIIATDREGNKLTGWRGADWEDVETAGKVVADEVMQALSNLREVQPRVRCGLLEVAWPMQPAASKEWYEAQAKSGGVYGRWAQRIADKLNRGENLPTAVPIIIQGIQLANGVRLVGLEGEATAPLGNQIIEFYGGGATFALGYCNGEGLYLPASYMIDEGGYEVSSYWEYGWPAPLAKGFEQILADALQRLRALGIE